MNTINIQCETCHKIHEVTRTNEIPDWVISMGCNWCPLCEDRAKDYYEEWYNPDREGGDSKPIPDPVPDNQLCFPFLFEEMGIKEIKPVEA